MPSEQEIDRLYNSIIRVEEKVDSLLINQKKLVTQKESNTKTLILAVWSLVAAGIAKFEDLIQFFK